MIPESTAQRGTEAFYRARLVVIFSVALLLLVATASGIRLALGRVFPATLGFFQIGLLLLLLWRFRRGMPLQYAAHALIAVLISSPMLLILGSGAAIMAPLMAMVIFPILASELIGARGGLVWSVVSVVTVIAGLILGGSGIAMPIESGPYDWERSRNIGMPLLMFFAVFVAWVGTHLRSVTLDELEAARLQADAASAAKSRFLANMSHEIRTPLNGVLGTGRLLQQTEMAVDQRQLIDTVVTSGEALLELLDGVLDLSKIEAGSMSLESIPLDLDQVARGVVGLMDSRAREKGIALRIERLSGGPWWVYGDPTRTRQVLLNLVGNAIKFTLAGSVTLRIGLSDDVVTLAVVDTGIGIASERLPDLFEEFSQADATTTRKFGGTGLGLTISQHFVRLMGGHLQVESTPGVGTTFTALLPATRAEPPVRDTQPVAERLDGLRVLVAEDHPVNQLITRKMLEQAGCEVLIVDDGEKAVEAAGGRGFDVVLMDCHMPVMDGFTAARIVREQLGTALPIIALTAAATTEDRRRCFEAGMDDYLTKPVSLVDLTVALSRFLREPEAGRAVTSA